MRFNNNHYMKVFKTIKNIDGVKLLYFLKNILKILDPSWNITMESKSNLVLNNHFLLNQQIRKGDSIYTVESVNLQFYEGWTIWLLLNSNGSHVFIPYKHLTNNVTNDLQVDTIEILGFAY